MTDEQILNIASRYASHDDSNDEFAVFRKAHVIGFAHALLDAQMKEVQETLKWMGDATQASDAAPRPADRSRDAIERSKPILEAVDTYLHRPDRMNRNALRSMIFDEFEELIDAAKEPK